MVDTLRSFFVSSLMPKELNSAFIVLIPKVVGANRFQDFCAIGLCNVVYKLISKILANGMRLLLYKIIPPSQLAFMLS